MRKTCGNPVQIVRTYWARTQIVYTTQSHQTQFPANKHTCYTRLPRISSQGLPTANLFKITPVDPYFSPLSTALIITTTK
jgi:hypothetical protein